MSCWGLSRKEDKKSWLCVRDETSRLNEVSEGLRRGDEGVLSLFGVHSFSRVEMFIWE